jgi:hypothetical protein
MSATQFGVITVSSSPELYDTAFNQNQTVASIVDVVNQLPQEPNAGESLTLYDKSFLIIVRII